MDVFPAELCILSPRPVLIGSTGEALSNVIVTELPDGALCMVPSEGLYKLDKSSSAAVSSPNVIATGRGAGVPGRWLLLVANANASLRLISELIDVDIPSINQDQNVVVAVDVTGMGFQTGLNLIANVPDGINTGLFIGECFVESETVVRIKFGNNTANPLGPYADTPIRFTQILEGNP